MPVLERRRFRQNDVGDTVTETAVVDHCQSGTLTDDEKPAALVAWR